MSVGHVVPGAAMLAGMPAQLVMLLWTVLLPRLEVSERTKSIVRNQPDETRVLPWAPVLIANCSPSSSGRRKPAPGEVAEGGV
jgi:hypothetical protein